MPVPPPGQYFVVAIPEAESGDWQNPTVLQKLSAIAERVQIRDGQPTAVSVTVKRVPK
jgi:hypothetical protein